MRFIKKGEGLFVARDIVRLFFVINFFILYIALGLDTELESECVVLLSVIVAGSIFCGWACPFGAASYFISKIGSRIFPSKQFLLPPSLDSKLRYARYLFLAFFLYLFVVLKIDYFGEHFAMYMSTIPSTVFFVVKYIVVFIVPLFVPFFFCKYMCWQKIGYNIISRIVGTTKIVRDDLTCVTCKKCDKACPMNLPISSSKVTSGVDCFTCFNCMQQNVCPKGHESLAFSWLGMRVNIRTFSAIVMVLYVTITIIVLYY